MKIASKSMTQASSKMKSASKELMDYIYITFILHFDYILITFRSRTLQFQSVHWFPLVLKCYQRVTLPTLKIPFQTKKSSQTKGNLLPGISWNENSHFVKNIIYVQHTTTCLSLGQQHSLIIFILI